MCAIASQLAGSFTEEDKLLSQPQIAGFGFRQRWRLDASRSTGPASLSQDWPHGFEVTGYSSERPRVVLESIDEHVLAMPSMFLVHQSRVIIIIRHGSRRSDARPTCSVRVTFWRGWKSGVLDSGTGIRPNANQSVLLDGPRNL